MSQQSKAAKRQGGPEDMKQTNQKSLWGEAWIRFRRNKLALISLIFLSILVILAIGTFLVDIATNREFYMENVVKQDLLRRLEPPSAQHIFGLDEFGRDMLLRVIWGIRYSLFMSVIAVMVSILIGGTLGALAGYYGKQVDNIIMRFMDILLAIPSLLLAIAIVAAFGTSLINVLIAIGISYIPTFARTVRAAILMVKDQEYIEAARAIGASDFRIITKYIIPNALSPIIVQATLSTAGALLSIAGLSFLGLGIQPPTPEWGTMLSNARTYIRDSWHITVIPGVAIMLTILSLNLVGDGLRDALDPKLKK